MPEDGLRVLKRGISKQEHESVNRGARDGPQDIEHRITLQVRHVGNDPHNKKAIRNRNRKATGYM